MSWAFLPGRGTNSLFWNTEKAIAQGSRSGGCWKPRVALGGGGVTANGVCLGQPQQTWRSQWTKEHCRSEKGAHLLPGSRGTSAKWDTRGVFSRTLDCYSFICWGLQERARDLGKTRSCDTDLPVWTPWVTLSIAASSSRKWSQWPVPSSPPRADVRIKGDESRDKSFWKVESLLWLSTWRGTNYPEVNFLEPLALRT